MIDKKKLLNFVSGIKIPEQECKWFRCVSSSDGSTFLFERKWSDEYLGWINKVSIDDFEYVLVYGPEDTMDNFATSLRSYLNEVLK